MQFKSDRGGRKPIDTRQWDHLERAGLLKPEPTAEPPGRLVKAQMAGPTTAQSFCCGGLGWALKFRTSNKSPGEASAAGPGSTPRDPPARSLSLYHCRTGDVTLHASPGEETALGTEKPPAAH